MVEENSFFNEEKKIRKRVSKMVIDGKEVTMTEYRPITHTSPRNCDRAKILRTNRVASDGACENFQLSDFRCVYCMACTMSAKYKGIPYNVRERCDEVMGW